MSLQEVAEKTYLAKLELIGIVNKFHNSKKKSLCYPLLSREDYRQLKRVYSKKTLSEEEYSKLINEDTKDIVELSNFLRVGVSYMLFDIEAGNQEYFQQGEMLNDLGKKCEAIIGDYNELREENLHLISLIKERKPHRP